jgi:hypothetical protein
MISESLFAAPGRARRPDYRSKGDSIPNPPQPPTPGFQPKSSRGTSGPPGIKGQLLWNLIAGWMPDGATERSPSNSSIIEDLDGIRRKGTGERAL